MQVTFWDTAGQEVFDALLPMLYRKADVFVLVYDITKRSSFEKLSTKWMNDIDKYAQYRSSNKMKFMVIGNKADLEGRAVSDKEGRKFAQENHMLFYETSAKTGQNVNEAFQYLLNEVVEYTKFSRTVEESLCSIQPPDATNVRRTRRCCSSSATTRDVNRSFPSLHGLEASVPISCTDAVSDNRSNLSKFTGTVEHLYNGHHWDH